MSANAESRAPKRLTAGCRVSGTFGELVSNPDPTKRRCVRKRLFGNVICAVGHGKYKVAFDDGVVLECFSNRLRAEMLSTSIPPDVLPPQADVVAGNLPPWAQADIDREADRVIEAVEDSHEEEEHLLRPEDDESNDEIEGDQPVEGQEQHDPEGQMPGQLPAAVTQVEEVRTYAQRKERAKEHIRQLLGQEVEIRQRNQVIRWQVVEESVADVEDDATMRLGLRDTSLLHVANEEAIGKLFLHLLAPRWQDKLGKMNCAVEQHNSSERGTKIRPFSKSEFLVAIGLIVGAVEYGTKGASLWLNGKRSSEADWCSILPHPNFDRFMLEYRFKQFRQFLPSMYEDQSLKDSGDPWWKFAGAVTEFNLHHLKSINGSKVKVVDESMCAYRPRTTATGGLPNISFVKRKPEPLGLFCLFLIITFSIVI
jgi:hypothetical protein